jgi:hypothetical protein
VTAGPRPCHSRVPNLDEAQEGYDGIAAAAQAQSPVGCKALSWP